MAVGQARGLKSGQDVVQRVGPGLGGTAGVQHQQVGGGDRVGGLGLAGVDLRRCGERGEYQGKGQSDVGARGERSGLGVADGVFRG